MSYLASKMSGRGLPESEKAELIALKSAMKLARDRLYVGIQQIDAARSCRDLAEMKRLADPVLAAYGQFPALDPDAG